MTAKGIRDQTRRAVDSLENVIRCIPDHLWERAYAGAPLWKHLYHTIHSLDRWYVNPWRYREPALHRPGLDDLDRAVGPALSRKELERYLTQVKEKILAYAGGLSTADLAAPPEGCPHSRHTLILAQLRHLSLHTGVLMGFLVAEDVGWPLVLGLEDAFPPQHCEKGLFCESP